MDWLPRLDLLPWAEALQDREIHQPEAIRPAELVREVLLGATQAVEQKEKDRIQPDRIQG